MRGTLGIVEAKGQGDDLTPSRLAGFVHYGLRLWFGGNGNVNVGALFELHIIAVFVS
jgi:hypothetical protein